MKIKSPMLVVTDIDKSVEFYKNVFGLHVILDFGANMTLTGGLALQTLETWQEFIGTDDISFGSNSSEVYFEEDNFDKFTARQRKLSPERKAFIDSLLDHYQPQDAQDVQNMLKDLLGDTLQGMLGKRLIFRAYVLSSTTANVSYEIILKNSIIILHRSFHLYFQFIFICFHPIF